MLQQVRGAPVAALGLLVVALWSSFRPPVGAAAAKIDCYPIDGVTEMKCRALGCVWSPVPPPKGPQWESSLPFDRPTAERILGWELYPRSEVHEPWCYFPADYVGYRISDLASGGLSARLTRVGVSALGSSEDIQHVQVQLVAHDNNLVEIRISDADKPRFEPELPKLKLATSGASSTSGHFEFNVHSNGTLLVRRRNTELVVFSTDLSKLIFSDRFIQFNTMLSSALVYGLGEHYDTFLKLADQYKAYSFYNTDILPLPGGRRTYGPFPFYINLDANELAHGVYLRSSNALDIVIQPDLSITYRITGGNVRLFVFAGPRPIDVQRQFQELVGKPALPPRWSLGFHLCRYNYNSLNKTMLVYNRTRQSGIPYDVQWNDVDYMERANDFTYDSHTYAGLPQFVRDLHEAQMHYVPLIDPGLSQEANYEPYTLGQQMNVWIRNSTNQTLVGRVWNASNRTVWPDFSSSASVEYWKRLFVDFQRVIEYDGAWIDMNDISSFVDGSLDGCPSSEELERPPYVPGRMPLQAHSLCLSARHRAGREFDLHNLYSQYEAIATYKALEAARPGKRPFIISRSTSPGQGAFSGHWSGDVQSTWDYLRWSIPALIEHSMYGFSLMGTDICGFAGDTNSQLCARWSTLGAFYTFSRNHNDEKSIDQDPVAMGPIVVEANRNAFRRRYSLLPYLYSLMHVAHERGEPVVRSVPLEFVVSEDPDVLKVEHQFLWGEALMVSPVVEPDTYSKSSYLPIGRWYESNVDPALAHFQVPKVLDSPGHWHDSHNVSLSDLVLFYRGGHIVPFYPVEKLAQTIAQTVAAQPIGLEVALCAGGRARGELYDDSGDNVDGKLNRLRAWAKNNTLQIDLLVDTHAPSTQLGQVRVFGVRRPVAHVRLNQQQELMFSQQDHVLQFQLISQPVSKQRPLTVVWTFDSSLPSPAPATANP